MVAHGALTLLMNESRRVRIYHESYACVIRIRVVRPTLCQSHPVIDRYRHIQAQIQITNPSISLCLEVSEMARGMPLLISFPIFPLDERHQRLIAWGLYCKETEDRMMLLCLALFLSLR